jgi:outer membrane autotransporter protein
MDVDSVGVAGYGTYYREDALSSLGSPLPGDFWADALYGYQNTDYDLKSGAGSSEADTHRLEFNTGLTFRQDQITHGPIGGVVWMDGDIDTSGGGPSASVESFVTRLGYQASYHMDSAYGAVIPQVRATWEHEFENDPVIKE